MKRCTESLQIRPLDSDETERFKHLIKVFERVFEMKNFKMPHDKYLSEVLKGPGFKVVVAFKEEEIVGGTTIYVLPQYYSTKPLAYIYDLAVLEKHQRKGIGRKIIQYIREYFSELNFEEVFVQADEVDDYAIDFYRKTNHTEEEKVRHFYYRL